ncbi:hypothetical protein, partial [Angustibacter aerolatus]
MELTWDDAAVARLRAASLQAHDLLHGHARRSRELVLAGPRPAGDDVLLRLHEVLDRYHEAVGALCTGAAAVAGSHDESAQAAGRVRATAELDATAA